MSRFVLIGLLAGTLAGAGPVAHGHSQASKTTYRIRRDDSFLLAVTGKSGVFSLFAGHDHAVLATDWSATLDVDYDRLTDSSATITVPVSSLVIDSEEARQRAGLGAGPGESDVQAIQRRMLGPEVLDAGRFGEIRFTTAAVELDGADHLRVTGTIQMHGQSRNVTFPVRYAYQEPAVLVLDGEFTIRQTDFGLTPQSVAGGTVRVKDEVTIRFRISMVPAP